MGNAKENWTQILSSEDVIAYWKTVCAMGAQIDGDTPAWVEIRQDRVLFHGRPGL